MLVNEIAVKSHTSRTRSGTTKFIDTIKLHVQNSHLQSKTKKLETESMLSLYKEQNTNDEKNLIKQIEEITKENQKLVEIIDRRDKEHLILRKIDQDETKYIRNHCAELEKEIIVLKNEKEEIEKAKIELSKESEALTQMKENMVFYRKKLENMNKENEEFTKQVEIIRNYEENIKRLNHENKQLTENLEKNRIELSNLQKVPIHYELDKPKNQTTNLVYKRQFLQVEKRLKEEIANNRQLLEKNNETEKIVEDLKSKLNETTNCKSSFAESMNSIDIETFQKLKKENLELYETNKNLNQKVIQLRNLIENQQSHIQSYKEDNVSLEDKIKSINDNFPRKKMQTIQYYKNEIIRLENLLVLKEDELLEFKEVKTRYELLAITNEKLTKTVETLKSDLERYKSERGLLKRSISVLSKPKDDEYVTKMKETWNDGKNKARAKSNRTTGARFKSYFEGNFKFKASIDNRKSFI